MRRTAAVAIVLLAIGLVIGLLIDRETTRSATPGERAVVEPITPTTTGERRRHVRAVADTTDTPPEPPPEPVPASAPDAAPVEQRAAGTPRADAEWFADWKGFHLTGSIRPDAGQRADAPALFVAGGLFRPGTGMVSLPISKRLDAAASEADGYVALIDAGASEGASERVVRRTSSEVEPKEAGDEYGKFLGESGAMMAARARAKDATSPPNVVGVVRMHFAADGAHYTVYVRAEFAPGGEAVSVTLRDGGP